MKWNRPPLWFDQLDKETQILLMGELKSHGEKKTTRADLDKFFARDNELMGRDYGKDI